MNPFSLQMARHGRVLSTRDLGREVSEEVLDAMASHDAVAVDFGGVEIATPSFLDELLTRLQGKLQQDEGSTLLLVVRLNEEVGESLQLVLDHRGFALAQLADDEVRLLGGTAQLRETLKAAQEFENFTAAELAEHLRIKLPNLHQRLTALAQAGAVKRTRDPSATRGKRYSFATARITSGGAPGRREAPKRRSTPRNAGGRSAG